MIDGRAYDLVVVPILAPAPIAWLAMGFVIDDRFAARLQSLTSLEVSFWGAAGSSGTGTLLATTMPADRSPRFSPRSRAAPRSRALPRPCVSATTITSLP